MLRKQLMLCLFALLSGVAVLHAEVISPYSEDFSGVDVTVTNFHPKGWGHFNSNSYYKATYKLITEGDNAPYLTCEQYYPYEAYKDCLVSPAVSGKVTIDAKLLDASSDYNGIRFFEFTKNSYGNFVLGAEIEPDESSPSINTETFSTLEFSNLKEGTYLGIRGHKVAFGNFTAESADVVLLEQLEISMSISETVPAFTGTNANNRTLALPESGDYSITFKVTLTNKGEVDYDSSTPNYTLTLQIGDDEIETVAIIDDIPAGQSVTNYYTFNLNGNSNSGKVQYYIIENVDGKEDFDYDSIANFIPWHSEFYLLKTTYDSSSNRISTGSTFNFGSVQEATSQTYYIYNDGTAPLTFSMSVSDGFSASIADNVTELAAEEMVPVTFTINADEFGPKTGTLEFETNATNVEKYVLNLAGNVLDPAVYYESFDSNKLPDDMITESNYWQFSGGVAQNTYSTEARLILPKLTVAEGDELLITAARTSSSSYYYPSLKVYKSADRKEWELVGEFGSVDIPSSYSGSNFINLSLTDVPAGDWYLAFDGAYIKIDEIYGFKRAQLDYDVAVTAETVPETAEVNSAYSASLSVRNVGPALTADQYKAKLIVGGDVVAVAESVDLAKGSSATFDFKYTPHAVGDDLPVAMQLEYLSSGAVMTQSSEASLTISEEVMRSEVVVGTKKTDKHKNSIYGASKYIWSDLLYKADYIGIDAGTQINKIAFVGDAAGNKGDIKVWIENTDMNSLTNKWSDPEIDPYLDLKGFELPSATDQEVFVLDLSGKPFEYTGQNIRIRIKGIWEKTGTIQLYYDNTVGSAYYDYESSDRTSTTLYNSQLPVAYISIAAEPIVVSGVVTGKDEAPVADAKVTVKSGNVEYYGTSAENGEYTVMLLKAISGYSVNVSVDGYFDYSADIDVTEGSLTHDVQLIEAKGLYLSAVSIPTDAVVNYPVTATATVENCENTAATTYSVNLYVGGVVVASAEGIELEANTPDRSNPASSAEYTLTFVPHAEGDFDAYIAVEWGEEEAPEAYSSNIVEISVVEEVSEGMVIVGEPNSTSTNIPMSPFYFYSQSEASYSPEQLGLPAGAELLSLTYMGYYNPGMYNPFDAAVKVWLKNSEEKLPEAEIFNTDGMTLVYDSEISFTTIGSAASHDILMNLTLSEPFKYEGGYLYVMISTVANGSNMYYETDKTAEAYYRTGTTQANLEGKTASKGEMPVVRITFDNKRFYTGQVVLKDDKTPVENARVTLSSDGVEYSGTTDSDGRFEIVVIQHTLTYSLRVEHPLYVTHTAADVDLSSPAYVELSTNLLGVENVIVDDENVKFNPELPMYDIMGRRVSEKYRGVVIQNGHKFNLK